MNHLLELNGAFAHRKNPSSPGEPYLPNGDSVAAEKLRKLASDLEQADAFWKDRNVLSGELIASYETRVIPKSKRLKELLKDKGSSSDDAIRGAYYLSARDGAETNERRKHVFVYYVKKDTVRHSIELLETASQIVDQFYEGKISYEDTGKPRSAGGKEIIPRPYRAGKAMSRSLFFKLIFECDFVERFAIPEKDISLDGDHIIRIYKTDGNIQNILKKFGISLSEDQIIDETTAKLSDEELEKLSEEAPFLVAMSVRDLNEIPPEDSLSSSEEEKLIRDPSDEPIVGVIDQPFDPNAYCSKWVENHCLVSKDIPLRPEDYRHGTAVTSLIVDGVRANPELDDGCGYFRVRHFGVAAGTRFSSMRLLKQIREIIEHNQDIRVWNLSLGSESEANENCISPVAAELDRLQNEYNIVFVVAGTNIPKNAEGRKNYRIGSPADSINSIVVNSVDRNNNSASYSRIGPVLSFYNKPDISCFGGDGTDAIHLMKFYESGMCGYGSGTSLAAPWITRKMAYLINVIGLPRETAKALLIDSACGWNQSADLKKGYGVVPTRIEDVINARNDEIRFVISGYSSSYETYNFNIPIPVHNNKQPYYARATLAYYPECDPNQGVDYTDTELDIHIGRINDKKQKLADIQSNHQSEEGLHCIFEDDARKYFRKWDNIKHIAENISQGRVVPRTKYGDGLWGVRIVRKERRDGLLSKPIRFGLVVTLKEMYGVNRYEEFVHACSLRNWIVNEISIENRVNIYQKGEQDITFE